MKVHFLGTASALVTIDRDNTSLLVESGTDLIILDCGGNPAGKILRCGYKPANLSAVLLTHLHIDHCYGLPALLFHMFLEKRTAPLDLFCPEEEFEELGNQLRSHGIDDDVRTYSIRKKTVPPAENERIWETDQTVVYSGISQHSRPTRAYKILEKLTGRTMVYTGDTTPREELVEFARNVDLLVHEATYLDSCKELACEYGHSTAAQAGDIANRAQAKSLALVHYECAPGFTPAHYRSEAARQYQGCIHTPDDLSGLLI